MSLVTDAESPKVAFENVELKENGENGNIKEVGKEKPGDKCKRLICDNKFVTALVCLAIISIAIGIGLLVWRGSIKKKERVIREIPTDYRLPDTIVPRRYALEVQPDMNPERLTFEGKVEISVACVHETDKVILHSKDLTIEEEDLRVRNMNSDLYIKVSGIENNETTGFLILYLEENMVEGNEYIVFLAFHGKLQSSGKGFYVSIYYDEHEEEHYVASTQYEALHAREGFPCFDEPLLKATFQVTIVRWRNMSSLSNMPRIKTESRGEEWVADTFLSSMKMSTYLVAYYVGEYIGKIDRKVRVWAPKHRADQVDYSLEIGNRILSFFEETLQIPYGAPKLDMIPVTVLVAAAMENWGLIIYADDQLLYDRESKDVEERETIATTVAHEIAHQWFGNLVTPKWWSDIWLSEGMTTYMENRASMNLFPQWNEIDKTVKTMYDSIYDADCYEDVGFTVWKNVSGEKITLGGETFGPVTYLKGAMTGRTMHYLLGNETFWRGISAYLKEYSYGNVEEKDLWRHLTEAQFGEDKVDMAKVMWTWTHTSGSPIVTVKRDYNGRTATLTQHSCKRRNVEKFSGDLWEVPISYSTPRDPDWNPKVKAWLTSRQTTLKDMPKHDEWLLVNGNSNAFYLVSYDEKNWELLAAQLRRNHEVFSADQRFKILADANLLYKSGNLSVTVVLHLTSYLKNENILSIFNYPNGYFFFEIVRYVEHSVYDGLWQEYMTSILAPILEKVGWSADLNTELKLVRQLRALAARTLCEFSYPPCVAEAARRVNIYRLQGRNQSVVTAFNKDYLFCAAARSAPWSVVEYFLNTYDETDRLAWLACSENVSIIENYLFEEFRKGWREDFYQPIANLMRNRVYWRRFLDFLKTYLGREDEEKIYSWLSAVNEVVASQLQKERFKEIVRRYIDRIENEDDRRSMEKILEKTEKDIKDEQETEKIGRWLERRLWMH